MRLAIIVGNDNIHRGNLQRMISQFAPSYSSIVAIDDHRHLPFSASKPAQPLSSPDGCQMSAESGRLLEIAIHVHDRGAHSVPQLVTVDETVVIGRGRGHPRPFGPSRVVVQVKEANRAPPRCDAFVVVRRRCCPTSRRGRRDVAGIRGTRYRSRIRPPQGDDVRYPDRGAPTGLTFTSESTPLSDSS
jgi:hypothetical protein